MPASKDIARLNTKVTFLQESVTPDGYGGVTVDEQVSLMTWAQELPANSGNTGRQQLFSEAGVSALNKDKVFRIRVRDGFEPSKSMKLEAGGNTYTIQGTVPEEVQTGPVKYLLILCKRAE